MSSANRRGQVYYYLGFFFCPTTSCHEVIWVRTSAAHLQSLCCFSFGCAQQGSAGAWAEVMNPTRWCGLKKASEEIECLCKGELQRQI